MIPRSSPPRPPRAGFTLVEVIVAMSVTIGAITAMLGFFWGASTLAARNTLAAGVVNEVRLGVEYLAYEIADARSLALEEPNTTGSAFSRVIYTKNVGLPGRLRDTNRHDLVLSLAVDAHTRPAPGDELLIAGVTTLGPILITEVEDPRDDPDHETATGARTEVRLRINESLHTLGAAPDANLDDGVTAFVTRRRAFATHEQGGELVLAWFDQADSDEPALILARPLAPGSTHPFSAATLAAASTPRGALGYDLEVQTDRPGVVNLVGGNPSAFASSTLSGVVAPRSVNTSLLGAPPSITLAALPPPPPPPPPPPSPVPPTTPPGGPTPATGDAPVAAGPVEAPKKTPKPPAPPKPEPPPITVRIDF
jgi:hypothetical protein